MRIGETAHAMSRRIVQEQWNLVAASSNARGRIDRKAVIRGARRPAIRQLQRRYRFRGKHLRQPHGERPNRHLPINEMRISFDSGRAGRQNDRRHLERMPRLRKHVVGSGRKADCRRTGASRQVGVRVGVRRSGVPGHYQVVVFPHPAARQDELGFGIRAGNVQRYRHPIAGPQEIRGQTSRCLRPDSQGNDPRQLLFLSIEPMADLRNRLLRASIPCLTNEGQSRSGIGPDRCGVRKGGARRIAGVLGFPQRTGNAAGNLRQIGKRLRQAAGQLRFRRIGDRTDQMQWPAVRPSVGDPSPHALRPVEDPRVFLDLGPTPAGHWILAVGIDRDRGRRRRRVVVVGVTGAGPGRQIELLDLSRRQVGRAECRIGRSFDGLVGGLGHGPVMPMLTGNIEKGRTDNIRSFGPDDVNEALEHPIVPPNLASVSTPLLEKPKSKMLSSGVSDSQ